ncbi:MAG: amidohydrolase family protein [Oscillospiraceae bacterium]|jgi:guanine deaminase|nr:amidohydrolase family protein [Oscillospiraceae bacterium]
MNFILKGDICCCKSQKELETLKDGYLICENALVKGIFAEIPAECASFPVADHSGCLIIPGLCDLHVHAPQYAFRGLGMDAELLDWLEAYTFPEESKYVEIDYANSAYSIFADAMRRSATTRACVFATLHTPATMLLMDKLDRSGIVTYVGKVNMDRNCPDTLRSESADAAIKATDVWIRSTKDRYKNTSPIITPRFVPACSDELMEGLGALQRKYGLPVQSHLSENKEEIAWVRELCPQADSYAGAYDRFGLFGGAGAPTIMAHCVWSEGSEENLLKDNGVFVAHCPQSNINLSSGIAPIRRFITQGIKVGLGSDVAGGCHLSILRAMSDAIQSSKLYWRIVAHDDPPLSVQEAFYLGSAGGGAFFGKAGSFIEGYEFDAVVIDDSAIPSSNPLTFEERLARIIYFSDDSIIRDKYVRGAKIDLD